MEGSWARAKREAEEVEEGKEVVEWPSGEDMKEGGRVVKKSVDFAGSIMENGKGFKFGDNSKR